LAVIRALEAVEDGRTPRLMLLLPPGSAKSTYASKLFPAWWMARHPAGSVIAASHTASLAVDFGRAVRGLLAAHGPRLNVFLRRDARAAGAFQTESGGSYFAIGVQGAVTGRRADLAVIDDPVASFEDAAGPARREHLWNWYRSELVTRMKPGGRIVLAMTRWHPDDIAGRLIEQGGWHIVRLPALAELGDPLDRAPGDALWPDWESREAILAKQTALGERQFAAMFQQAPMPEGGTMFDVSKILAVDCVRPGVSARGWDFAAGTDTQRDPDWTAGVKLTRCEGGEFVVDDVQRARVAPGELRAFVHHVAQQDGTDVTIGLPQDPGQAGSYQITALTQILAGYRVVASAERGPKDIRADKYSSQINNGNFRLCRAPWNRAFLEELAAFPHGRKDDQVDALSRAFALLTVDSTPARYVTMPIFDR
jgi:predicted phage terminase large subunit-like protein